MEWQLHALNADGGYVADLSPFVRRVEFASDHDGENATAQVTIRNTVIGSVPAFDYITMLVRLVIASYGRDVTVGTFTVQNVVWEDAFCLHLRPATYAFTD